MKKGVEALSLIAGLIILLIVIVVFFQFTKVTAQSIDRTANVNEVRLWALTQAQSQKFSSETAGKEHPPVANLGGPIVIADEDQLKKSHKQIADGMYDCWSAFNKGETNFLAALGPKTFCYPCVEIRIDDSLKNKGYKMVGLNSFIAKNKPRGGMNMPTYLEYLTGEKNIPVGVKDEYDVNDDMYVFFVASAGRSWGELAKTIFLGYDENDNAQADILRAQMKTLGAGAGAFLVYNKADGIVKLAELQESPGYQALQKETGELQKQVDGLSEEIKKLKGEGKDLTAKIQEQESLIKKLSASEAKAGQLESAAVSSAKAAVSSTAFAEGQISKEMLEDVEFTQGKVSNLKSRLAAKEFTAGEQVLLERELEVHAVRLAKLEANIARATTKATVEVAEKALVVTSEVAAVKVEKGLAKKATVVLGKRLFAKGVVRFVPYIGQAIAVGDIVYTGYKVVMGDRKFSATVMIDDAEHLKQVCNPEIREEQIASSA